VRVGNKSTGVTANFLIMAYGFVPLILSPILIFRFRVLFRLGCSRNYLSSDVSRNIPGKEVVIAFSKCFF
jgi:hypothetical protein